MRLGGLEKMWSLTPPFLGTFRPSFLTFLPKERWSWALWESGGGRDSESSCWEEMLCARAAPHCTSWFLRCFFSVVAVAVEPCMGCEICGESRANPAAALGKKKSNKSKKCNRIAGVLTQQVLCFSTPDCSLHRAGGGRDLLQTYLSLLAALQSEHLPRQPRLNKSLISKSWGFSWQ